MEASQNLTNFISFEELDRMGFDPIPHDEQTVSSAQLTAGILANRLAFGLIDQPKIQMPFIPKPPTLRSQFAPEQVIDPCPPLARMPQGRFGDRSSRERDC